MKIKRYNEGLTEEQAQDLIWLYDTEDINNILGFWVTNGMVESFTAEYYLRKSELNANMGSTIYKPEDPEITEAYVAAGFCPCIDIKFKRLMDMRIVITEFNSLISHMPEYKIYKIQNDMIRLKQIDYPSYHFKVSNRVLAEKFPMFQSLHFETYIEKVNLTADDERHLANNTVPDGYFKLANVSSTNWANPCYVITFEYKMSSDLAKHDIELIAEGIKLMEQYKDHIGNHTQVVNEFFKIDSRKVTMGLQLRDK